MDIFQAIVLGLVQGVTEFAPISSSAHLVIVPSLLGWSDAGVAFDVALHLGTLFAVIAYFRGDIKDLLTSFISGLTSPKERNEPDFKIALFIMTGTIPAAILGLLLNDFFEALFNDISSVSILLIFTGCFIFMAEKFGKKEKRITQITLKDSLLIGLSQAVALAPGVSRSGVTISTGLLAGLDRESAARFSFLLSIPIIAGAAVLKFFDFLILFEKGQGTILAAGFFSALLSGYLCIKFLLSLIKKSSLYVFSYYCFVVGFLVLIFKGI